VFGFRISLEGYSEELQPTFSHRPQVRRPIDQNGSDRGLARGLIFHIAVM
jgi:hypothetical protein